MIDFTLELKHFRNVFHFVDGHHLFFEVGIDFIHFCMREKRILIWLATDSFTAHFLHGKECGQRIGCQKSKGEEYAGYELDGKRGALASGARMAASAHPHSDWSVQLTADRESSQGKRDEKRHDIDLLCPAMEIININANEASYLLYDGYGISAQICGDKRRCKCGGDKDNTDFGSKHHEKLSRFCAHGTAQCHFA